MPGGSAARIVLSDIDYRYLYRQDGDIVDKPDGLKPKPARRVYTNLTVEDFSPTREPLLFPSPVEIRMFFVLKGETVDLKSCPACRSTYDSEFNHVCIY